jgi:hypothetical protein
MILAVLSVALGTGVGAQDRELVTTCIYNPTLERLEYGISGGTGTYTITTNVTGCVGLSGAAPSLTGPVDEDFVGVVCNTSNSTGTITLQICQGQVCFSSYQFRFACTQTCEVSQLQGAAPGLELFGIVALILILAAAGALTMRRQTA